MAKQPILHDKVASTLCNFESEHASILYLNLEREPINPDVCLSVKSTPSWRKQNRASTTSWSLKWMANWCKKFPSQPLTTLWRHLEDRWATFFLRAVPCVPLWPPSTSKDGTSLFLLELASKTIKLLGPRELVSMQQNKTIRYHQAQKHQDTADIWYVTWLGA